MFGFSITAIWMDATGFPSLQANSLFTWNYVTMTSQVHKTYLKRRGVVLRMRWCLHCLSKPTVQKLWPIITSGTRKWPARDLNVAIESVKASSDLGDSIAFIMIGAHNCDVIVTTKRFTNKLLS